MNAREFNLLEEPWVRVLRPDCTVAEVSLSEALLNAHEYVDLAGEMPTQDAAVLRVLLALLFAIFLRVDVEGREAPINLPREALARWKELWALGHLPERPLHDYFDRWHDRFWLFDPDHPFFQVPDKAWKRVTKTDKRKGTEIIEDAGTPGDVAKLNGELLESNNKVRLFKTVAGTERLTYAEAARWVIALMAYDDTAAKATRDLPEGQKYPSPGAGWLGRLGYIQAQGRTLFETLLLNLTLLQDGVTTWQGETSLEDAYLAWPCWELETPRNAERTDIPWPQTPAALYTVQSRRLRLFRQQGGVVGYLLLGGDFFSKENAFREQMTLWREQKQTQKNAQQVFVPRRHDMAKQFWREFPVAFVAKKEDGVHPPGLVGWIAALRRAGALDGKTMVRFRVSAMGYGDKDFFVNDTFRDELGFHATLLDELRQRVRLRVIEEIGLCEQVANAVGVLARNLAEAAGDKNGGGGEAREVFYFRVDRPFRQWLEGLDPEGDVDVAIDAWRKTAREIAFRLGDELAYAVGPVAFVGRVGKNGHISTAEALRAFRGRIRKLYPETKGA